MEIGKRVFAEEREQEILRMLQENGSVTVDELSRYFGISGSTIRRQLKMLEDQGKLLRTFGGAIKADEAEESFDLKRVTNMDLKKAIAQEARKYINDGDIIALGGGTTVLELAKLLSNAKNLVVITNSIATACELYKYPNIEVQAVGGAIRSVSGVMVGPKAVKFMENAFVEKTFVGTDSISLEHGLTTTNCFEAEIEKQLMMHARTVFVITDHTKFGKVTLTPQMPISNVDYIITDKQVDEAICARILEMGVKIITV